MQSLQSTFLKAKLSLFVQTPLTHCVLLIFNPLSGPELHFFQLVHNYALPTCGTALNVLPVLLHTHLSLNSVFSCWEYILSLQSGHWWRHCEIPAPRSTTCHSCLGRQWNRSHCPLGSIIWPILCPFLSICLFPILLTWPQNHHVWYRMLKALLKSAVAVLLYCRVHTAAQGQSGQSPATCPSTSPGFVFEQVNSYRTWRVSS